MYEQIIPRDERERQLIAEYERDVCTRWDVEPGLLIRRSVDGKLIRLPDRRHGSTYDAQVATDLYVMGRGPGREHGVIAWWIDTAHVWPTWDAERQARAIARARHNEEVYQRSLITNPPAAEDAHKFAPRAPAAPVQRKARVLEAVTA